MSPNSQIFMSR